MKFIPVALPPHLPKGWSKLYSGRIAAMSTKVSHAQRTEYLRKYPSWGRLKAWLSALSYDKCWYCEAKSWRAPLDVDHFRPKLAVTVDGQPLLANLGYYWVAYEWWNFRLSCQRCNRPEKIDRMTRRGKWNEFPLQDEANRRLPSAVTFHEETPRLLDPCVSADCALLAYGVDGEVKASAASGTWDHERADYTINLLGMNDWNIPEERKKCWQGLSLLVKAAGNAPTPQIESHIRQYLKEEQEYLAFFRSAIGTLRDNAWIDAML